MRCFCLRYMTLYIWQYYPKGLRGIYENVKCLKLDMSFSVCFYISTMEIFSGPYKCSNQLMLEFYLLLSSSITAGRRRFYCCLSCLSFSTLEVNHQVYFLMIFYKLWHEQSLLICR